MKILFLTHNYPRYKGDASGVFLKDLAESLSKNKQTEILIIAPHEDNLPYFKEEQNVKIIRFKYFLKLFELLGYGNMLRFFKKIHITFLIFIFFLICFIKSSVNAIKKYKIDIIHAHWILPAGFVGAIVKAYTKKPLLISVHGTDLRIFLKNFFSKMLIKFVLKRADKIITVSEDLKTQILKEFKIFKKKVEIIPMPVRKKIFYSPIKWKTPKNIITVGRLDEQKGIIYLLKAIYILIKKGYKNIKLYIVGEGPLKKSLIQKAKKMKISKNVEFKGFIPRYKIPTLLSEAQIFVLPSLQEGFGIVFVEAMLKGLVVCGTCSGGIKDIIEDGITGLLFKEKNPKSIALTIEKILKNKSIAKKIAKNGQEKALKNFTEEVISKKFLREYIDLTKV